MTITLYQFPANQGDFRASAPCIAVEAYLRLAGIDYRNATDRPLRGSNTSILPAIEIEGRTISDSENILRFLEARGEPRLDAALTPDQQAEKIMLWRLMNGSIYQLMVAERWLDPEVYPVFVASFREMMLPHALAPLWPLMRRLVTARVRGKYLKSIAHLTAEERAKFMDESFGALAQRLGERAYLFGDAPSSADAFLFAYTYAFLAPPYESPTGRLLRDRYPNLVAFYERESPRLVGDVP